MIEFTIPLADWINQFFEVINYYLSPTLRAASRFIGDIIKSFENLLLWPPESIVMIVIALILWRAANYRIGIFGFVGLLLAYGIGIWDETMSTIALALSGTIASLIFGIPLGIFASQSKWAERIVRPILDFMQTLPSLRQD